MVRNKNILEINLFPFLGNSCWREENKTFDSNIGTLEPYTESIPSVLILTAVWVTESNNKDDKDFQG